MARITRRTITREPELDSQARPKIRAQGGKLRAGSSMYLNLETQRICDDEDYVKYHLQKAGITQISKITVCHIYTAKPILCQCRDSEIEIILK